MNKAIRNIMDIDRKMSTFLAVAYYGAYVIGPPIFSGCIKKRFGYRVTFIVGLIVFALGCFSMWPAASNYSFGGMVGAHFVVGLGVSTLENSANPYAANCGPQQHTERRLNFAQAWAAFGTVVAPLVASKILFVEQGGASPNMTPIITLYRSLGGATLGFTVLFGLLSFWILPEVEDEEPTEDEEPLEAPSRFAIFNVKTYPRLWFATIANFCNLGAQVGVAQWFIDYCVTTKTNLSDETGSQYLAVAQALFCIGRFVAVGMMMKVKPRFVLLIFVTGAALSSLLAMFLRGNAGIAMLCLIMFFESTTFPTIFATGEKGLGRHTKLGGNILIMSISGGALQPPLMGVVTEKLNVEYSFMVPLLAFTAVSLYAGYINTVGKKALDRLADNPVPDDEVPQAEFGGPTHEVELPRVKQDKQSILTTREKATASHDQASSSGTSGS